MTKTPPILPIAIGAFAIVAFLLMMDISIGVFQHQNANANKLVACSQDAKLCPDGSYVGRQGSRCAFATCPTVASISSANEPWTTGSVPGATGFSYRYPTRWGTPEVTTGTVATDPEDVAVGNVAAVHFTPDRSWYEFGVTSNDFRAATPTYMYEDESFGSCVNGYMTVEPAHAGAKLPCQHVTINGRAGTLLVYNEPQEGCYNIGLEYVIDWPYAPYSRLTAFMSTIAENDTSAQTGIVYCTQHINYAQVFQNVLDQKGLTTNQLARIQEFTDMVASITPPVKK